MSLPRRTGFASKAAAQAVSPIEARRAWLLFLSLARDHCRRALEGEAVDRFEAQQFVGFVRTLFGQFPAQTPACALYVGLAARDLARGLLSAAASDQRTAIARLLLPALDYLDAAVEADTRQRSDLARRISGERED